MHSKSTVATTQKIAYKLKFDDLDDVTEEDNPFKDIDDVVVSSTKIRNALNEGDVKLAADLLGYNYHLSGIVIKGNQLGRTIGFPTANLQLEVSKLIPKGGVYAVDVLFKEQLFKGILNIGVRPTVLGETQTIEVHILDFEQNIYGETLTLKFRKRIRDEYKFASIVELKTQLENDKLLI